MKQVFLSGLAMTALLAGTAVAQDSREVHAGPFDRINAGGGFEVEIIQGDTPSVRLVGDAGDFDDVEVDVRNGLLDIDQDTGFFSRRRSLDVVVEITVTHLTELDFNRGVSVQGRDLVLGDLELEVSTGAEVRLSGSCATLDAHVSTGAYAHAGDLVCEDVDASGSTGADLRAHATQSVSGRASTGASIRVYGSPSRYEFRTSMGGSARLSSES